MAKAAEGEDAIACLVSPAGSDEGCCCVQQDRAFTKEQEWL